MRVRSKWTDEHQTTRKTGHGRRKGDHDGRIRVRYYAGERCLPKCVTERHGGLTPGVMASLELSFLEQNNALPYVAKSFRDFCSAQHMQLLPWPVYSSDMSPIEHVWDLVGRCS
ncbi:transposable element Tcb2 transposase [Trichonephila clavipes]|nr:transposable element Tcb2 transposase [Trichonephila clavipes]